MKRKNFNKNLRTLCLTINIVVIMLMSKILQFFSNKSQMNKNKKIKVYKYKMMIIKNNQMKINNY